RLAAMRYLSSCLRRSSFLFQCYVHHRDLHSFPTRRSSDLGQGRERDDRGPATERPLTRVSGGQRGRARVVRARALPNGAPPRLQDRKSTRLNSSHGSISYAVFCLKKKRNKEHNNDCIQTSV